MASVVELSTTTTQVISNLSLTLKSLAVAQSAQPKGFSISDIGSLLGMVFGTAGLTFSAMNYFRDRPRIKVSISWDMDVIGNGPIDKSKKWGIVSVANVGRRPIFVSHVAIRIPPPSQKKYVVLIESAQGKKLSEGDAPATFVVDQSQMKPHAKFWKSLRVQISDSAGKVYYSEKNTTKPSWGE